MSYFTTKETFFIVPLSTNDGEIEKIDYLLHILEESGVGKLIEESNFKSSDIGRKAYNPYRLFASILYCFTVHKGTLRDCEEMIKYDSRLWYLMNQEYPSYKTIHEFINEVILPNTYKIFTLITSTIVRELKLDISDNYLDGTKIEANANKYKFVFKPRKFKTNLIEKIKKLLSDLNISYEGYEINPVFLNSSLKNYEEKEQINIEEIKTGKGIKLTRKQKLIKQGYKYLDKLLEYQEKEIICGPNRNSYYKTDKDATAMALKADYYSGHGSNMHAAYNVQFIVSSGLILMFSVFQDRTDYYTLIPMIDLYEFYYGIYPNNLCADAGYGTFRNYEYINKKGINNYIKYQNWNGETKAKRPQLFFLSKDNKTFYCLNGVKGKEIPFSSNNHQKNYKTKRYKFIGCLNCPYEYKCKQAYKEETNERYVELSTRFEQYKSQARENLKSVKGIEIRINRSIQVEGSFGILKQDMNYVRLRRRGIDKVKCEIMMMALAFNIRKLFSLYKKKDIKSKYWEANSNTKPEEFKQVKPKEKSC